MKEHKTWKQLGISRNCASYTTWILHQYEKENFIEFEEYEDRFTEQELWYIIHAIEAALDRDSGRLCRHCHRYKSSTRKTVLDENKSFIANYICSDCLKAIGYGEK